MKYCVFIHKYCDSTITANYGGYFYSMASEKEQLYLRLCAGCYELQRQKFDCTDLSKLQPFERQSFCYYDFVALHSQMNNC